MMEDMDKQQQTGQVDTQPPQYGNLSTSYSAPPAQYGAPPAQHGAPPAQYGAPPAQYSAPPVQHGTAYPPQAYMMQGQQIQGQPIQGQPMQVQPMQGQPMHTHGIDVRTAAGLRPVTGMTSMSCDCSSSLSPLTIVSIIKIVCWLSAVVSASVALSGLSSGYRYGTWSSSSFTSHIAYAIAICVITLIADIALLVLSCTGLLSTQTSSQPGMTYGLMTYNALCILLYYISLRIGWIAAAEYISYSVFVGIGIAACATELSIHVNTLKEQRGPQGNTQSSN